MTHGKTRTGILFGIVFLSLISAGAAFAETPIVNSFTVDPQSLSNNYSTALAWNTANSAGRDLHFSCPPGVTIKKAGAGFPCNMRQSISGDPVDWAEFTFTNVSGATQNVVVTFYPKDTSGANYDQGAVRRIISVQTSAQPIIDFSLSSSTLASGAPITLTWKGVDAGGVNFQFECAESVRIRTSATATETLPCGKPAFAQDKAISGSLIVYPINSLRTPVSLRVSVLPGIGGNIYDATHSLSADFTVIGAPPPATPSASEFRSSVARLVSNDSADLSWATKDSAGANIKFLCQEGLSVFASSSISKIKLPCGTPAFATPLASRGTTTISVGNTSGYAMNLEATLLPQDANGTYFLTTSLSLTLPVLPAGTVLPAPSPSVRSQPSTAAVSPAPASVPQASITPAKAKAQKYIFSRPLRRGSKNADVAALQKILAQYPDVYPGGLITGFFGPATEKALGLFQEKYGVAKKGNPGYGTVGPNTRAKLNSLQ